jgi:predicted glutamine amidotransferase
MCRLFAQHAPRELDRADALCRDENALRFQSHKHPHGWGIAWWVGRQVWVRRGLLPAHADQGFVDAAQEARSRIVLAHIRDASVGPVMEENTHPFVHGRWVFAHNGTVANYLRSDQVRAAIEAEIDRPFRDELRGQTDSERCFYLVLTRLAARVRLDQATLVAVEEALTEATRTIQRLADAAHGPASSLNFLLSDGRLVAASRLGRTLHVAHRAGPEGVFAVASEPIGRADWREVPEGAVVGCDGDYSSPWTATPRGNRTS